LEQSLFVGIHFLPIGQGLNDFGQLKKPQVGADQGAVGRGGFFHGFDFIEFMKSSESGLERMVKLVR
jgi:hypothetical protein